jgi:hypothetical protein
MFIKMDACVMTDENGQEISQRDQKSSVRLTGQ